MTNLIKKDMTYFLKNNVFYIMLIIYMIMCPLIIIVNDSNTFYDLALGLKITSKESIIEIIMYIFNYGFYVLIVLQLLLKNFNGSMSSFLLRITPLKWIIYKLLSIAIVSFITRFLTFCIILFYLVLFKFETYSLIEIFLYDFLYIVLIQNIFLLIYMIYLKNIKVFFVLLLSLLFLSYDINILIFTNDIINLNLGAIVLIVSVLLVLLNLFIGKNTYNQVFERSN
ncbi:MAG: hypothetical protein PHU94_02450 [Bacilli bacterium]|nr:hypothetical protein [Bacilli bacterium]MDD4733642.1 hypothetical protein [Bacilli bacterium]